VVVLTIVSLVATLSIRPELADNYNRVPLLYLIPIGVAASLAATRFVPAERSAFVASCVYLALMLGGAAAAVYPNLLISSSESALNITVHNAHSGEYALRVGLVWWTLGMAVAVGYFVFVYRMFAGKITLARHSS